MVAEIWHTNDGFADSPLANELGSQNAREKPDARWRSDESSWRLEDDVGDGSFGDLAPLVPEKDLVAVWSRGSCPGVGFAMSRFVAKPKILGIDRMASKTHTNRRRVELDEVGLGESSP
jgi:hypothetical protein